MSKKDKKKDKQKKSNGFSEPIAGTDYTSVQDRITPYEEKK